LELLSLLLIKDLGTSVNWNRTQWWWQRWPACDWWKLWWI